MKDQYFGDFGDYQKISLLKKLKQTGLRITTHWMKTVDDGSNDGKHITYLQKPDLWRNYEPGIFDFLVDKISTTSRSLSHIEKSTHCEGIDFINKYIESTDIRRKINDDILQSNADIVFFDPDNGIEVASTNKKNIHKYVTWDELIQTFNTGKSVLVYQHFSRSNRDTFINNKITEIQNRVQCTVVSIKVKHSVYFFILQKNHLPNIEKALGEFMSTWHSLAIVRKNRFELTN